MFVLIYKIRVVSRLLRHLLITILANRTRHNKISVSRKLIHARAQRITMILNQMIMDFGTFTAEFTIRTFEHFELPVRAQQDGLLTQS